MTKYEAIVEAIRELNRHIEKQAEVERFASASEVKEAIKDRTRLVQKLLKITNDDNEA